MASEERWLDIAAATAAIVRGLRVPAATAYPLLVEACLGGAVRARDNSSGEPRSIPYHSWVRERADQGTPPDGVSDQKNVTISDSDLRKWIRQHKDRDSLRRLLIERRKAMRPGTKPARQINMTILETPIECTELEIGSAESARPEQSLRQAPAHVIDAAITQAYNDSESSGSKPPNIKELPDAVLPLLAARGCTSSKRQIMTLGDAPHHRDRRRPVGQTFRRQRRALPR